MTGASSKILKIIYYYYLTTRIPFVSSLIRKFWTPNGDYKTIALISKEKKWRILVVVAKWRHQAFNLGNPRRRVFTRPNLLFLQIKELPYELTSINSLVIFLTRFLWHISAHHAAINYPLTDYGGFTLNMPTKLYRDSRVSDDQFSLFNFPNANISAVSALNSIRIQYEQEVTLTRKWNGWISVEWNFSF